MAAGTNFCAAVDVSTAAAMFAACTAANGCTPNMALPTSTVGVAAADRRFYYCLDALADGGASFGASLALDHDARTGALTLAVGAPGVALVFVYVSADAAVTWTLQQTLSPSDSAAKLQPIPATPRSWRVAEVEVGRRGSDVRFAAPRALALHRNTIVVGASAWDVAYVARSAPCDDPNSVGKRCVDLACSDGVSAAPQVRLPACPRRLCPVPGCDA